jgi:hypothetical protein
MHAYEETTYNFNVLINSIDFGLFLVLSSTRKIMSYRFLVGLIERLPGKSQLETLCFNI